MAESRQTRTTILILVLLFLIGLLKFRGNHEKKYKKIQAPVANTEVIEKTVSTENNVGRAGDLIISGDNIRSIRRGDMQKVVKLKIIGNGLDHKDIVDIISSCNPDNLKHLDLSDNELGFVPAEVGRLYNLEVLILRNDDLTELPEKICELENLKKLDISKNNIKAIPGKITELRNLEYIYIK